MINNGLYLGKSALFMNTITLALIKPIIVGL